MKKCNVNLHRIIEYLILIPFLNPRGFYEVFPVYKTFMTGWIFLALLLIIFEVCTQYRGYVLCMRKKAEIFVFVYFTAVILITLIVQGGLYEGLQNMIATPILCIYAIFQLRKSPKHFLVVLSAVLTILFLVNLTIFNPYIMQYRIAEYHVIFLGHVQVAGQFGALGFLCSSLLYNTEYRKRAVLLAVLSILTMATSGTSSAILVMILVILGVLLYQMKLYEIFCKGAGFYVVIFTVLGAILVFTNIRLPDYFVSLLNSRHQIWCVAMDAFTKSPIIGYGVQGVTMDMYWGSSLNYAHSQFAQNLLDGGIVLCILYYAMVFVVSRSIRLVKIRSIQVLSTLTLIACLCVSLFESVSFYPYFSLILMLLMYLPELSYVCKESAYEL